MRITKWASGFWIYYDHPNTWQDLKRNRDTKYVAHMLFTGLLTNRDNTTGEHMMCFTLPDSIRGRL